MNILVVSNFSLRLEFLTSIMLVIWYSCRFCILIGGFGSSGVLIGGVISGNGLWRKYWFGLFLTSRSSVYVCWCILHGRWHVDAQLVVQDICVAILSAILMVGVILL